MAGLPSLGAEVARVQDSSCAAQSVPAGLRFRSVAHERAGSLHLLATEGRRLPVPLTLSARSSALGGRLAVPMGPLARRERPGRRRAPRPRVARNGQQVSGHRRGADWTWWPWWVRADSSTMRTLVVSVTRRPSRAIPQPCSSTRHLRRTDGLDRLVGLGPGRDRAPTQASGLRHRRIGHPFAIHDAMAA